MSVFVVVSQNERDLAENKGHFSELEQDVNHAFETVTVEELSAVLSKRIFYDLRAIGPVTAGIIFDALDRQKKAKQHGRG
jgi:hypothetical protein